MFRRLRTPSTHTSSRISPVRAVLLTAAILTATVVPFTEPAVADTLNTTFGYTGAVQTFTVPHGVHSITLTMAGGQGGRGGHDTQGEPAPGGYRGIVTGSVDVTPGQVLTIGVGQGGTTGVKGNANTPGGAGGLNPMDGYDGARGGRPGTGGGSGAGGGGGAATVVRVEGIDGGDDIELVAAGAGGGGGSGQFLPVVGRRAESHHSPRPDATSTDGRPGLDTATVCSPGYNCDGGGSGAGGGGAQGGDRGDVQYGGATATEYFGFGGYPGANSTGGVETLSETYEYFAGNNGHGSVVISYESGRPGAPLRVSGAPKPGAVDLTWSPPSSSGSAAITDYLLWYSTSPSGTYTPVADGTSTNTSATVSGLTNGTTYYFRVAAVNSYGTGANSAPMSVGVMPSDVPAAPRLDQVTAGDSSLVLSITPGATHSPVIGHEYSLDGDDWIAAQAVDNRITVGGLTNGQTYAVRVRARNAVGASAPSSTLAGSPRAVPSTPSNLIAQPGDASVQLNWSAPASSNGSPIQDYVIERATVESGPYTVVPDDVSVDTTAAISGLTNGTTYYFRVAAVNAAGTGVPTTPSAAVPATLPSAPQVVSVEPVDGGVRLAVDQPSDGGSAVLRYEYRLGADGPWVSTGTASSTFGVGGLTNGVTRTGQVRAVNALGASDPSTAWTATPRSTPGAPAISTVALDTGAVEIDFSLSADGGSPVTNYEYSLDGGTSWLTRSPASPSSPLTISGLTGGRTYQVALRGVNDAGHGAASNVSTVIAKGTPGAPRSVEVTAGDRSLTASFETPANGGSPITNYEYSLDGGDTWTARVPASTGSPITIGGLVNGTPHQLRIRAVNAVGSGEPSSILAATPRSTPGAPTIDADTIVGVDGRLDVVFTAPSDDGGAAITDYEYSTDAGRTWRRRDSGSTGSPLVITTLSSDGSTPLAGGQVYPVELRAVNATGAGRASAVADGITTTVPDAPSILGTTAVDSAVLVELDLPANGGSEIVRYEYRLNGGAWTDTGSLSERFLIAGLQNASTYEIEVRAVNGRGPSTPSDASEATVRTAPAAPVLGSVLAGDRTLQVSFEPGDDGGSPVTTYEYSTDGGVTWRTRTDGTIASPLTITSTSGGEVLVNGELLTVQIRARNAAGPGDASRSTLVAPLGAPDTPGHVGVASGDGRLTVSYAAGSDGGAAITAAEYRLDGGAWVGTGSLSSPFEITGLTNGVEHVVEVRLVNDIGASIASVPVPGTPSSVPTAPTAVVGTGGDRSMTATWSAPSDDGGVDLVSHIATLYDQPVGGIALASCTVEATAAVPTTCGFESLLNGRTVYLSVVSTNAVGAGPASAPRVAVTPLAAPTVAIASVSVGANVAVIDLDVDDGGEPVADYEYSLDGGDWVSATTSSEPVTIGGLVPGRTYSVRFRGTNAIGTSAPSAAVDVTPRTTPASSTSLIAQSGDRSVALSWTAPDDDGGDPVSDHVVQYSTSISGPFLPFDDGVSAANSTTVSGLTNGTEYFFRVVAVNGAGAGLPSTLVAATPLAAPGAPTITSLTPGNRYLQANFTANAANGGSPVTRYEYSLDGGAWRPFPSLATTQNITGLDNGHRYSVTMRAVNAVGGGAASPAVQATPFGLPGGVQGFLASPGAGNVTLTWDPVDDNGSPITAYNLIRWSARSEGSILASYQTTATSYTVPSLANGTHYFTIEATNIAGTGLRSNPRTSAMVGSALPAAPTVDTLSLRPDASGHLATLTWSPGAAGDAAITGTVVRRVTSTGTSVTLASVAGDATSAEFPLRGLAAGDRLSVASISAVGVGPSTSVHPPIVGAAEVADVTAHTASVTATVDANSTNADVWVEVAPPGAFDTPSTIRFDPEPGSIDGASDTEPIAVRAEVDGLDPSTPYQARVVASAGAAVTVGAPVDFRTQVVIATTGLEHAYDGTAPELSTETQPAGIDVERTYEGVDGTDYPVSAEVPTEVGSYRVVTSVVDGQGSGVETALLTISPRALDVEVSASGKVYDGTTDVELFVELSGAIEGDDVDVDAGRISGAFDRADAGADVTVRLEVDGDVLTGLDAGNYTATVPATASATITPRTQSLSWTGEVPDTLQIGGVWRPEVDSNAGLSAELHVAIGDGTACALVDGELRALDEGLCMLMATQTGNANVTSALPIAVVIQVTTVPAPTTTVPTTTVPAPTTTAPAPTTTAPAPTTTAPSSRPTVPRPDTTVHGPTTSEPSPEAPTEHLAPAPAMPNWWLTVSGSGGQGGSAGSSNTSGDGVAPSGTDGSAAGGAADGGAAGSGSDSADANGRGSDGADVDGRGSDGTEDGSLPSLGEETSQVLAEDAPTQRGAGGSLGWLWVPTACAVACCAWFALRAARRSRE